MKDKLSPLIEELRSKQIRYLVNYDAEITSPDRSKYTENYQEILYFTSDYDIDTDNKGWEIKNNDIIVFNSPLERRILLVKRISKIYHTGDTLIINSKNFDRLKKVVEYEHKSIFSKNGKVFINGTADSTLRLQQSYYYVLGDNIQNSLDSRTFGYVPESSIVGKMSMILYSIDNKAPLKNRCRLSRTFMPIK